MPELPEVETTCKGISKHLVNKTIAEVIIRQPKLRWPIPAQLKKLLPQQKILSIERRAKYILISTTTGTLIIHLGMSGSLRIVKAKTPFDKHDHFDLILKNGDCLRLHDPRRFGAVLWTSKAPLEHKLLCKLGPEPLTKYFSAEDIYKKSRKRKISVKQFIMDAYIVVGVGNIYASEALFLAGIHPRKAAGSISLVRYEKLVKSIKTVLNAAIKQGGTTLKDFTQSDGKPGYFQQQLNVYGRKDKNCLVCKKPISHCVLGQRATYYCTQCQK